ncbi:IS4 family transposase [Roseofilum reptotaenium CS-1145]|uniref:Transposase IS4-like domain-containing protein n=1 Tax=Roseofilum reptotaenium AO1-A TaxID=1925591 RepID=A0A1L9QU16_9CYAN|nr:IS4 family transposase [Roseofilum reptotaenium]MDB9518394.1 IS4 family transposase [Roseofilum reptotaenium CS-1145]OJJ26116.1 hypothetical protein BI308_07985 [Roseofilum reptotaenium AO1-A]
MFPELYQKILKAHLSLTQYLTLNLLVLVVQGCRNVALSKLAERFPQPIKVASRVRSIQRLLSLKSLNAKKVWFPIVRELLKKEKEEREGKKKKKGLFHQEYLLLVIDRTQWKERNVMMLSLVWGTHALPVYWEMLRKKGSSSLEEQERVLSPVLELLKEYKIVVIGDREFQSVKLGEWLYSRGVDFVLRQKKSTCIAENSSLYESLESLEIRPGMSRFYREVYCGKSHQLGPFNLTAYWKRKYRGKGPKEAWFILTSLDDMELALSFYSARWGIETLFKDCKTGGYNLEETRVNEQRLLATILVIAMAYTWATLQGIAWGKMSINSYLARPTEKERKVKRHSHFYMGCYGLLWVHAFQSWSSLAQELMESKPHKRLFFQKGLNSLSLIQSTL